MRSVRVLVSAAACLTALLAMTPSFAGEDELTRLREENARLKAQIEALQKAQAAQPRAAAPAPSSPAAQAAPAATPAANPSPASAAAAPAPEAHKPPLAPPGYKLVKEEPPPPPYSETDCKNSPQYSGRRAPWRDENNWLALQAGMSMAEVQQLLGPEHYDVSGDGRIGWQYGKCGASVRGMTVFQNGKLVYWKKPVF